MKISIMDLMPVNVLFSHLVSGEPSDLLDPGNPHWTRSTMTALDRDWLGRSFIEERGLNWRSLTQMASVWTGHDLFFLFECWYKSLESPSGKSEGTNNQNDQLELLLRPESCDDYFHWEITPDGGCVDSHVLEPRVDVDYHWESGLDLKTLVSREELIWRAVLRLPFRPIVAATQVERGPEHGEAWGMNLCRACCEGQSTDYVVWRPTFTPDLDFHQTSSLGHLFFIEE